MRVSVIIPTYNRPELLARQLGCLAQQSGDFIEEVIVCDDGSTTDTRQALVPFRGEVQNLRYLWQEDQGFRAGQARNMGIEVATGDVLLFLDDDLLLPQDFVARHAQAHVGHINGSPDRRAVIGFRHRRSVAPAGLMPTMEEILESDPDDRLGHLGPNGERLTTHKLPWFFVYSCNLSVPNDKKHVWFNEDFVGWGMEDTELGYRLVHNGYQVVVEPKARVLHLEAPQPRDPFRCEERGLAPHYDSYVHNMVQFIDAYPEDDGLFALLSSELRWYVRDDSGCHWVKNGHENDPEEVLRVVRAERAAGRALQCPPDPEACAPAVSAPLSRS